MNKLMAFFVFTFICGSVIGLAFEGATGIASTRLSDDITELDTTIPVVSVSGFQNSPGDTLDFLTIGKETLTYTGINNTTDIVDGKTCPCFTTVVRGESTHEGKDTTSVSHSGPDPDKVPKRYGALVMSPQTSLINNAIGFNVAEQMSTAGKLKAIVTTPFTLMSVAIKLVAWDFAFLEGKYVFLKYILLYPISAGFIWAVWAMFSGTAMSIFKGIK